MVAAGLLGMAGFVLWSVWTPVPSTPSPSDDGPPGNPLPLDADRASPRAVPRAAAPVGGAVDRALEHLAELEGATRLRCPDPGFVVARGPFLRVMHRGDDLEVLAATLRGKGLVYAEPGPGGPPLGLSGPEALVVWDGAAGTCRFDDVPLGAVGGVVDDGERSVSPSWVVGCGAAMEPVDEAGRFALDAPVGEPCRLQAEGRGEGVWVVPHASKPVDVTVPWIPPRGTQREEVALRLREQLDALDALEGQPNPLQEALDDRAVDDDVRDVLEAWRDEEMQLQEGRRRWLEDALRRYTRPAPPSVDLDAPDEWHFD